MADKLEEYTDGYYVYKSDGSRTWTGKQLCSGETVDITEETCIRNIDMSKTVSFAGYPEIPVESKMKWYFTFMTHQTKLVNKYVVFEGTYGEARKLMQDNFGDKWANQYDEERFLPQIEAYNLTEIK